MINEQTNIPKLYTPIFALLCLSQALFSASFNMIIPELPDYLRSIGGEEYIGLIIGLFTLTAGLSRPISGKLTDTIGRMPVQIIGAMVCVIASLMYPLATTVFGFLLLRFFHGFSTGFKPTATSAYLADIVPLSRRGEGLGILGVSMNLGASISPPIGSWIAQNYSMNLMFYISSAIGLASVLILLGMKETLDKKQAFHLKLLLIKKHEIIDKSALTPAIVVFFIYLGIGATLTICADQSSFLGMSNKGLFFTSFTVCSILSRVFAGKISDRYGREVVLIWSMLLITLSLSYFFLVDSPIKLMIATGGLGFTIGCATPAVFAWTIDRCSDANRGKALATIFIALEISIGFGAILSAWIYDNNPNNFGVVFLTLAFITSLGIVYLWMLRQKYLSPS